MKKSKYVHGRVRLATSSPRVGEYDYDTKSYTPPDFYGDHFLYRDDRNLLPTAPGLYTASSPYTADSTTAFPPQTLYDKHSSTYSGMHSMVPNPYRQGMLSGNLGEDDSLWGTLEAEETVDLIDETAANEPNVFQQMGTGIMNWWDGLSPEEKVEAAGTGLELAEAGDRLCTRKWKFGNQHTQHTFIEWRKNQRTAK